MSAELITAALIEAAEKRRADAAVAYQVALNASARQLHTTDSSGELARLRSLSELADIRAEQLRVMFEEQTEAAGKRRAREAEHAGEIAGMASELDALRRSAIKRSAAAQAAMVAALEGWRDYGEAIDRICGQLRDAGLGAGPGELDTTPLGHAGVRLAGQSWPAVSPAAVGHVITRRAATAALGLRNALSAALGRGSLDVLALQRGEVLAEIKPPKSTAPKPPAAVSRPARSGPVRIVRQRGTERSVLVAGDGTLIEVDRDGRQRATDIVVDAVMPPSRVGAGERFPAGRSI